MKFNSIIQNLKLLLLLLGLSMLFASCVKEEKKSDRMTGGSLVGVNYTGEGIQRFSVDNSGGGSIGRYSISGDYCCTMYPKQWTADLKVEVEWERSDCKGQQHLCTIKSAEDNTYPYKVIRKTIPIEQYTELGRVYLVFLPKDEVKLYISKVGPINPSFPSKLGFPEEPIQTQRNKK